jgi:hypothetical protein
VQAPEQQRIPIIDAPALLRTQRVNVVVGVRSAAPGSGSEARAQSNIPGSPTTAPTAMLKHGLEAPDVDGVEVVYAPGEGDDTIAAIAEAIVAWSWSRPIVSWQSGPSRQRG